MHNLASRLRPACACLILASFVLQPSPAGAVDRYDRVQLRYNATRGVDYVRLGAPGAPSSQRPIAIRPWVRINLDGQPNVNVFSKFMPIDVDGDRRFEFLQYNGFRTMKLWDLNGRKRWEIATGGGRIHDQRAATHRDSVAVLDLDGDGRQDIAHCWIVNGKRQLALRRGRDGKLLRAIDLRNDLKSDCHVAAVRTTAYPTPIILVANQIPGGKGCRHNLINSWARTAAYDPSGRLLWQQNTCDAGHFVYALDENQDGRAEGIFVGRYLLSPTGRIRCTLANWRRGDHADGVLAADIDPSRPGFEAIAVGMTGLALYQASTCRQIWRISPRTIRNPQHMALARLQPGSATPQIVVEERGNVRGARTFLLNAAGKVLAVQRARANNTMPIQNANLDGAVGTDELIGSWGEVFGAGLSKRASKGWFWRLKGSRIRETRRVPYAGSYGRWQAFPLVVDLDRDGRDEIVQWSQSLLIVGKAR